MVNGKNPPNLVAYLNDEKVVITKGKITNQGHLLGSINPETKREHMTLLSNYTFINEKEAEQIALQLFNKPIGQILADDEELLDGIQIVFKKRETIPHFALAL